VPGCKTDVSDAAWLQRLHEFGLLRGSFQPQGAIAALRAYLRQRDMCMAGERDPDTLASYRDIRCHSSAETVRQALIGNYREEHLFASAQAVELYEASRKTAVSA
jgi:hypothetical protein